MPTHQGLFSICSSNVRDSFSVVRALTNQIPLSHLAPPMVHYTNEGKVATFYRLVLSCCVYTMYIQYIRAVEIHVHITVFECVFYMNLYLRSVVYNNNISNNIHTQYTGGDRE